MNEWLRLPVWLSRPFVSSVTLLAGKASSGTSANKSVLFSSAHSLFCKIFSNVNVIKKEKENYTGVYTTEYGLT